MSKKRLLPPDRLAECKAAHDLFLAKKNELKLSQKKIAEAAGMTPAAVNLYFKGINPLNAQFAAVLSFVLKEPVERFSPRLAKEIAAMAKAVQPDPEQELSGSGADLQTGVNMAALLKLKGKATPRSLDVLKRIEKAALEGRLKEADLLVLEGIAARFEELNSDKP